MYVRMYVCSHATKGEDKKKERERESVCSCQLAIMSRP